jgi:hypothetical protein
MSSILITLNNLASKRLSWQFLDFGERVMAGVLLVMMAPLLLGIWLVVLLLTQASLDRAPESWEAWIGTAGIEV